MSTPWRPQRSSARSYKKSSGILKKPVTKRRAVTSALKRRATISKSSKLITTSSHFHKKHHGKKHGKKHHRHHKGTWPTHEVFKSLTEWPDEMTVKLEYRSAYEGKVSLSKILIEMRGNGPFDPDVAVGGGQPRGFDQWASKYQYYNVSGSSCMMEFMTINDHGTLVCALWPADSSLGTTGTPYADGQRPYSKFGKYEAQAEGPLKLTNYISTKKVYGIPSQRFEEQEYSAAVSANPSTQWYWRGTLQNQDLTNELSYYVDVKIVYYITFYDRKDPADAAPIKPRPSMVRHTMDGTTIDLLSGEEIKESKEPIMAPKPFPTVEIKESKEPIMAPKPAPTPPPTPSQRKVQSYKGYVKV